VGPRTVLKEAAKEKNSPVSAGNRNLVVQSVAQSLYWQLHRLFFYYKKSNRITRILVRINANVKLSRRYNNHILSILLLRKLFVPVRDSNTDRISRVTEGPPHFCYWRGFPLFSLLVSRIVLRDYSRVSWVRVLMFLFRFISILV